MPPPVSGPGTPLAPFSSPFAAILNAVLTRVSESLNIPAAYVQPVATDEYKVTIAEPLFAYLRVFGVAEPRDPAMSFENAGAGRLFRPIARRIRVYVWTRSGEDVVGEDSIALMGQDPDQTVDTPPEMPGQFAAEELVFNALDDFLPVSDAGEPLSIGPLHPLPTEGTPPLRKAENGEGLVWSAIDFEAVYCLSINPQEPPS